MTVRFLFALLAVLGIGFISHANAQGTDTLSCSGEVTYPEGQQPGSFSLPLDCVVTNTPPPDDPPTVANLTASCDEDALCEGNIGAADDNGFVVSWGAAPGVFIGNADGSWSWQTVDGDGLATYGIPGEVSDGVNPPVPFTLQVTVNDSVQAPPPPAGNLQAILDMPAGSWLQYGAPWSDLETSGELDRNRDNCGRLLSKILTGWQGLAFDGTSFWNLAGAGHGDSCFNGILRYDLEAAQPEVSLPHMGLNVPVCWGPFVKANGTTDCYYEPYASAVPAPICATNPDPNCEGIPLQDRLDAGLSYPSSDAIAAETEGQETFGAFLRPRSSHDYNNTVFWQGHVYLMTGQTYGGIRADAQVWRFDPADPEGTLERLPNRWNPSGSGGQGDTFGGTNANLVPIPGRGVLMFAGQTVCEADMAAGTYDCAPHPINVSGSATMAWDEGRQGVWVVDSQFSSLDFLRETDGVWDEDLSLSVTDALLSGASIGRAGICLVPTDTGANPVIWGTNATLVRWDGTTLSTVTGQVGQPATSASSVLNKWRWNADLGVCLGAWDWNRGIEAWRPDFSNWQEASLPPPDPEPDPQPGDWPVFAGHTVAPAAWTPAAWNEPIEVQPEAPDYAAACPGVWNELHYTTDADLAGSAAQTRGLGGNVRVYLHGREASYVGSLALDKVQCGEVIGVPESGFRPVMTGGVSFAKTGAGLIVRGVDFQGNGANVGWGCYNATMSCPVFVAMHDNTIGGAGIMGVSDPTFPTTYLELRGNIFGPNLDWHGLYLERSIGQLVALSNVFHGSGNAGHSLKNLANYARIEGNVFSNVGIDGQPFSRDGVNDVIGLFPLDHYACTDSIVRNNTIVFRTSGNVATLLALRGRNAWGNCDKGTRLADGSRELFPPESEEYLDEQRWSEIALAAEDFALGYAASRANPELFTHLIEGNTFVVFDGKAGVIPRALSLRSMRPIADNTVEADLKDQLDVLLAFCTDNQDFATYDECWFASASEEVLYVRDHIDPSWHFVMMHGNGLGRIEVPNSLPIRAPANWVERTGVFWDEAQTYIACNADGTDCAERGPYSIDDDPSSWDDVQVASPPLLIPLQ